MDNIKNKVLIIIPFIAYIIIFPLYIYTYKNSSNMFWYVFIIERVFSFLYEDKLTELFDKAEENLEDTSNNEIYILFGIILFSLFGLLVLLYILFNYFKLFIILMIGEFLDKVFDNLRINFRKNKTIGEI